MNTIEKKTQKAAPARNGATAKKSATKDFAEVIKLSLDPEVSAIACKLADAENMTTEAWIRRLIHSKVERRPIMFPAATVELLEELLGASGTALSLDQYADEFLQQEILASLSPGDCGVPEILAGVYRLDPDDVEGMRAVVDRWKAKGV